MLPHRALRLPNALAAATERSFAASAFQRPVSGKSAGVGGAATSRTEGGGEGPGASPHVARDVLTLYRCVPGGPGRGQGPPPSMRAADSFMRSAASVRLSSAFHGGGPIHFDTDKWEAFVKRRTYGREKWALDRLEVKL